MSECVLCRYDIAVDITDFPAKPAQVFGRSSEWGRLAQFVDATTAGSRLAVVYGRRRQGKTLLLQELAVATGGFYWEASLQSRAQNLESLGQAWSLYRKAPGPLRFQSWDEALTSLLAAGAVPGGIFLDEIGYLIATAPEFPSLLQRYFGPQAERKGTARVVLCGSIYSQMTRLLAADQPLRGRHTMVLDVGPFDYRIAADYWGLTDNPDAAFRMHALVGGTPAYLRYCGGIRPSRGNVDEWATRYLLDVSSPLYHEGEVLVAEDPTLGDKALYWAVLSAVADGNSRTGDIANAVGRPPSSLAQSMAVLVAGGWIEQRPDPFHAKASTVMLTEPILRTHRVLISSERQRLSMGQAQAVWDDGQQRMSRLILGPHLEWMANDWAIRHATAATMGGSIRSTGSGILRAGGRSWQVDIVGVEPDRNDVALVTAIGEVKAEREPMGVAQLTRLDEIAAALGRRAAPVVRRLLVARSGFTAELRRSARQRGDVELVDLDRLYGGS